MAAKTITALLNGYFNSGENKVGVAQFRDELKELSPQEKQELAEGVAKITGDTVQVQAPSAAA